MSGEMKLFGQQETNLRMNTTKTNPIMESKESKEYPIVTSQLGVLCLCWLVQLSIMSLSSEYFVELCGTQHKELPQLHILI